MNPALARAAMLEGRVIARLDAGDAAGALTLAAAPGTPPAALGMAHLAADQPTEALACLRAALAAGDARPVTRLNVALAESRAGDASRAETLLAVLERDAPDWAEPPFRRAEIMRQRGDTGAAARAYARALALDPAHPAALHRFAQLDRAPAELEPALDLLRRCCASAPKSAPAWHALAALLARAGQPGPAHAALLRAHALAGADLPRARHLVASAVAAGQVSATLAALETADLADPVALATRALLLAALGRHAAAADLLDAAATLAPTDPALAILLAEALARAGRDAEVLPTLERALALAPADAGLRNNHAAALTRAHRHAEARAGFAALIAAHGESPELLCNLAGAEANCGEQDAAVVAARRATELAPGSHLAWRTLANTLAYQDGVRATEMLEVLSRAGACLARGGVPPFSRRLSPADADRRLRVGLLSANLRTHPVGWLALAGLETLDPRGFELVCLAQPPSADPMQRRFRAAAAEWHVLDGADPAAQARALDLDIVIDLGGYGDRGMLPLCAERLAPLQVKWVGLQNHSTGLAEMDWLITDRWETPAELAGTYSERLLFMPDGYACYTPPPHAPDVAPLPALRRGHVTFGCFNNYAKVTPALVASWCAILHAVPTARLVLKTHQFRDAPLAAAALGRFAAHGIDPKRIELRGASAHRALLEQYADVDLVLDPHPYSGGVTTCEALWMGVPVLTLPGETFASRHSASHLANIGLDDWVAADRADYVSRAVAHAADVAALARLRAGLRARMRASPLCDAPRFGRHLGAALRRIWREACG